MAKHELKTWSKYFALVDSGLKKFELRKDDRNYQVGDTLVLREWTPWNKSYTGLVYEARIIYVLRDAEQFGLMPGYVILGITKGGDS